jgi:hypothetical protein
MDASTFHVYFLENIFHSKEPNMAEFFSGMIGAMALSLEMNIHPLVLPTLISGIFSPSQPPHEPENEISPLLST